MRVGLPCPSDALAFRERILGSYSVVQDFREPARWFAPAPAEGDPHRLWSAAFGLGPACRNRAGRCPWRRRADARAPRGADPRAPRGARFPAP
ncbi:DUF2397 family protein [Streptomyces mirabilis]|uniref:DUF2397 family protein n=1 Tax=Streptomyces mirabilis TaxID=68239 RepID=UPI003810124B